MANQVTRVPNTRSAKPGPPKLLIISWVLTALAGVAFCLALASQSLGGFITTILLLVVFGSIAIFLSLAEMSVRSERRFRERLARGTDGE